MTIAAVFVGAAGAGALVRAVAGRHLNRVLPLGTLVVNVAGSFLLGLLATSGPPVLTVLGTAGLGALTTFSSFARDTVALWEEGEFLEALGYVAATVVLGVGAAGCGVALTG